MTCRTDNIPLFNKLPIISDLDTIQMRVKGIYMTTIPVGLRHVINNYHIPVVALFCRTFKFTKIDYLTTFDSLYFSPPVCHDVDTLMAAVLSPVPAKCAAIWSYIYSSINRALK